MGTQLLTAAQPSVWLLTFLGIAVVFVGLVLIVGIVILLNKICDLAKQLGKSEDTAKAPAAPAQSAAAPAAPAPIPNREEIVAAVCAAVAEEEGVDISALRVLSFKKL